MKNKFIFPKLFLLLLWFFAIVSSCIVDKSDKKDDSEDSLTKEITSEKDDGIDFSKLEISTDSIDLALIAFIREKEKYKEQKFLENAKILIEKGANPTINVEETSITRRYVTYIPIVKHFIKRKYNSTVSYTTAFHVAVLSGDIKLVELFYNSGFLGETPTKEGIFPIDVALRNNDTKMIDFLLSKNINLKNANLSTSENADLIVFLVRKGANPETIDINFALSKPEELKKLLTLQPDLTNVELDFEQLFANKDVFNLLISNGLNPNIEGKFPFTCPLIYGAIKFGTLDDIKLLVKKGANYKTDCKMQFYESPLIASIKMENTEKIGYFIDLGLEPNVRDWKGSTPLSEAIDLDNDKIIAFLIQKGAKVNYPLDRNETPLIFAVKGDKYIAAQTLIELKADLNKSDEAHKTALHYAIDNENLAMVKLLLESGIDKKKSLNGKSYSAYAKELNVSDKIIQLLN